MTTDVTTPAPTQRRSRARAQADVGPTTTLTVPAKPAAVTSANVAALAGTAVAATGPLGVALATVVAGGAAGGYAVYRAVRHRRAARDGAHGGAGITVGGGRGLPRAGRAGAASPGGRSGGASRGGSGRPAAGSRSGRTTGSGGKGLLGRAGSGSGRGLFGLGRSGSGRTGGGRGTGSGSGGTGHRRAGSAAGSARRSPLTADKVAAARRKLANRRQPGPRLSDAIRSASGRDSNGRRPTGREAFRSARRAVTGDNPKKRGTLRRAAAGLIAGAVAADKAHRERWKARKRAEAARQAKNDRAAARRDQTPQTPQRRTASTVRRPNTHQTQQPNTTRPPVPTPAGTRTTGGNPIMASQSTPQPTSHFWQSARQLFANAVKFKPKGMIEVRTEAYELPHSLAEIANALRARAQECTKQPLHPNLAAAIQQIATTVDAAAQASRSLGPAFDALHPIEVARILNPRANEGAWDTINNR